LYNVVFKIIVFHHIIQYQCITAWNPRQNFKEKK